MEYYHNLVTEKSWQTLQSLKKTINFVLIGGWAVYLYTRALKSKDIDLVIDYRELTKLKNDYQLEKIERLKKYHVRKGMVEIDIYLPYYSKIGIPVQDLLTKTKIVNGFCLVQIDYLLALKIFTLGQRGRSAKGQKDFMDIIALFRSGQCSLATVKKLIKTYKMARELNFLSQYLNEYFDLPELKLTRHHFAKLKKSILCQLK